jgi:hypothetical protein
VLESCQEDFHAVTARTAQSQAGVRSPLWRSVDRLVADAIASNGGDVGGLLAHKLGPFAAREEQRSASVAGFLAPQLVRRIRDVVSGDLLVLKGPEVAALYPAARRRFSDVDVLVRDAAAAQAALLAAGFVEAEQGAELDDHHHLHPLRLPSIWLGVEVHSAPNWPLHATAEPPLAEIFDAAVPSAVGVEGVSAPSPAHHALLLAAHAWRHQPLHLLRDLLDVAAFAEGIPEPELERIADRWGIGRVWRTTWAAVGAVFYDAPPPLPLRLWARHLEQVRPQTVLEEHLQRWLHPFWEQAFAPALRDSLSMIGRDVTPVAGETWRERLRRSADALRHLRDPAASRDQR